MNSDDVYQPREDVISRKLEDEIVLIDLRTESIYSLNETGAKFWELINEGKRINQINAELRKEYNISIDELEKKDCHGW